MHCTMTERSRNPRARVGRHVRHLQCSPLPQSPVPTWTPAVHVGNSARRLHLDPLTSPSLRWTSQ